jgi:hypothetical protein
LFIVQVSILTNKNSNILGDIKSQNIICVKIVDSNTSSGGIEVIDVLGTVAISAFEQVAPHSPGVRIARYINFANKQISFFTVFDADSKLAIWLRTLFWQARRAVK